MSSFPPPPAAVFPPPAFSLSQGSSKTTLLDRHVLFCTIFLEYPRNCCFTSSKLRRVTARQRPQRGAQHSSSIICTIGIFTESSSHQFSLFFVFTFARWATLSTSCKMPKRFFRTQLNVPLTEMAHDDHHCPLRGGREGNCRKGWRYGKQYCTSHQTVCNSIGHTPFRHLKRENCALCARPRNVAARNGDGGGAQGEQAQPKEPGPGRGGHGLARGRQQGRGGRRRRRGQGGVGAGAGAEAGGRGGRGA